jgi:hypothetical protein
MSQYFPRHTKKRERLHRLVENLRRAIAKSAAMDRIVKLAEEVRQAEIRVLRAERACAPRSEQGADARASFDAKISSLEGTSIEQVLERYGVRLEA